MRQYSMGVKVDDEAKRRLTVVPESRTISSGAKSSIQNEDHYDSDDG